MEQSLAGEARHLIASVRALLAELAEEGVDRIEPEAASPETTAESVAAAPGDGGQLGLIGGELLWGEKPTLDEVRAALGDCTRCRLSGGRTRIVFGDGNPDADLMFIGEGPGAEEDRRGLPFVGRAGDLLTQMIEKGLGIPRSSVYICNIVKCRPPDNRTPLADEVAACRPFLDGQISAVRPRVIVALGKPSTSLLLGRDIAITRVRGTWHEYRGVPVMPTFHPAYILRQYTPQNRRLVWDDLKAALDRSRA
ncbi:MAG: uracil-DNA glycosylase [Myxococcales bacterium]|nr:uracil-DNA glycosylase [Myxococcales bacterium]